MEGSTRLQGCLFSGMASTIYASFTGWVKSTTAILTEALTDSLSAQLRLRTS